MRISIKFDKLKNFLAVIYRLNIRRLNFEGLVNYELGKEELRDVRRIVKGEIDISPKLIRIYEANKERWNSYWAENYDKLKYIVDRTNEMVEKYGEKRFLKCAKFFGTSLPDEIDVYVLIGNDSAEGKGTALAPNVVLLFPRSFSKADDKTILADFKVLIHEVVHLLQGKLSNRRGEGFSETVIRAFAPRGILTNKESLDKGSAQEKMVPVIEKAMSEGKKYLDVEEDLLSIYNDYNKN